MPDLRSLQAAGRRAGRNAARYGIPLHECRASHAVYGTAHAGRLHSNEPRRIQSAARGRGRCDREIQRRQRHSLLLAEGELEQRWKLGGNADGHGIRPSERHSDCVHCGCTKPSRSAARHHSEARLPRQQSDVPPRVPQLRHTSVAGRAARRQPHRHWCDGPCDDQVVSVQECSGKARRRRRDRWNGRTRRRL